MFFELPGAAMRNVRKALIPGGTFTQIERYDCDICIGSDMDDVIEFAITPDPAGEIIRLAGEEGAKPKPQVVAALKDVLAPFARPDGIWVPSSTWFIAVTNSS
jgi:hypothetical protein